MLNIKDLRIEKKLSQDELALEIGISKRTLSDIENGKVDLTVGKLQLFASFFNVRVTDLLPDTAKKVTLKQGEISPYLEDAINITKEIDSLSRPVPIFDQAAFATPLTEWDTPEWLQERPFLYTTVPEDGNYFWFPVKGSSMSRDSRSSIEDGDFVLGRELYRHYWRDRLQLHRSQVWVIVHKYRGTMIKEITHHNVNYGIIKCHSWNPHLSEEDKYFELNLDDVLRLYYFKELKRIRI